MRSVSSFAANFDFDLLRLSWPLLNVFCYLLYLCFLHLRRLERAQHKRSDNFSVLIVCLLAEHFQLRRLFFVQGNLVDVRLHAHVVLGLLPTLQVAPPNYRFSFFFILFRLRLSRRDLLD